MGGGGGGGSGRGRKVQERGCGEENHMVVHGEGKRPRKLGASGRARVLEEREGGRRRRIRGD